MSDLIAKLKEKEQEKGKKSIFWRPNPGDILEGRVLAIGSTITSFGDGDYVELETTDGQKITIWLNSILKKLVEQEDVSEGDRVAIKFVGVVTSSKNKKRAYKDYVLVKDTEATEDAPETEPEAA